jgi:hypothetical protein
MCALQPLYTRPEECADKSPSVHIRIETIELVFFFPFGPQRIEMEEKEEKKDV